MQEIDEEELDDMEQVQRRVRRGVVKSLLKLTSAANAEFEFGSIQELRACVALSRLASLVFTEEWDEEEEPENEFGYTPEQIAYLELAMRGKVKYDPRIKDLDENIRRSQL